MSASDKSSALRLISRMFQAAGSSAASVISPSGGARHLRPSMSQTACKLQYELALNLGKIISTFGDVLARSMARSLANGACAVEVMTPS
jgi:hypothetical protein